MKQLTMLFLYSAMFILAAFLTDRSLLKWERTAGCARRLRKWWLVPYIILSLFPVSGAILPHCTLKYVLQGIGNLWLGFFLYYSGLLVILPAVIAALKVLSRGHFKISRHGTVLCLSFFGSLVLFGYGLHHAQQTRVVSYDLSVEKTAAKGESEMTLVLIGDLHLSVNSRLATTEKMVELINEQQPDAVVIAGDIFTSSYECLAHPERYSEALSGIQSKYGVYTVYGNHDVEEPLLGGFPLTPISEAFRTVEMESFCRDAGFRILTDQSVTLPNGIQLFGRIDGEKAGDGTKNRMTPAELLADADQTAPILVLQHEPIEFQKLAEAGADAALCGHTHAGQIFPGNLIVPFFNENAWGYRVVHGLDTFVTAGVGYYGPPMRVGTDSEVTVIHLYFQESAA